MIKSLKLIYFFQKRTKYLLLGFVFLFNLNVFGQFSAGPDQFFCETSNVTWCGLALNGSGQPQSCGGTINGSPLVLTTQLAATGIGVWSVPNGGTGSATGFSNINDPNATYTFSNVNNSSASVTPTRTVVWTGLDFNGIPTGLSDTMIIYLEEQPIAHISGPNLVGGGYESGEIDITAPYCIDSAPDSILLIGNIYDFDMSNPPTGDYWSGGLGTFTNPNNDTTYYILTNDEKMGINTPGSNNIPPLTWHIQSNNSCVNDEQIVSLGAVSPYDFIEVTNQGETFCGGFPNSVFGPNTYRVYSTSTSTSLANNGTWSHNGLGSFFSSPNSPNSTYVFGGPTDTCVTIYRTSNLSNLCGPAIDSVVVKVELGPQAGGTDIDGDGDNEIVFCGNPEQMNDINLNGTGNGIWSSSGSGTFSDMTDPNATYTTAVGEDDITLYYIGEATAICPESIDSVTILIPVLEAGGDDNGEIYFCGDLEGVNVIQLGATGDGVWSGGSGTFSNLTDSNATYTSPIGETSVTLSWDFPADHPCFGTGGDTVVITICEDNHDAGGDGNGEILSCASLSGTTTVQLGATGVGTWSGGTGTFSNLTDANATYTTTLGETTITLTWTNSISSNCACPSASDDVVITIAEVLEAGGDDNGGPNGEIYFCGDLDGINVVQLGATGVGVWSGGMGSFSNVNDPNSTYTTAMGETNVTLTWSPPSTMSCFDVSAASDNVDVIICENNHDAGGDSNDEILLCANPNGATIVQLGATGVGVWSGGTGTFSDVTDSNATYTSGVGEVTIILTWTNSISSNCACPSASDDVTIILSDLPTAEAGGDSNGEIEICETESNVQLNAVGNGSWSGGLGSFDNPNLANAIYTLGTGETSAILIWTLPVNGSCPSVSDSVIINLATNPISDAGNDIEICEGMPSVQLSASGTGMWMGGMGTFNDMMNPTTIYHLANGEMSVTLTWMVMSSNACSDASDDIQITVSSAPVADAGTNIEVCEGTESVQLSASGIGTWSGGMGFFSSNSDPNSTYTFGVNESNVTLTWTVLSGNICLSSSDDVDITIFNAPVAQAGGNSEGQINVCEGTQSVQLNATGLGYWSGGNGTFDNPSSSSSNYILGDNETAAMITWTAISNNVCASTTDNLLISVSPVGNADAGGNIEICQGLCGESQTIQLNAVGLGYWSGGMGSFDNPNLANAIYTLGAGETSAILTWTLEASGSCIAATDNLYITSSCNIFSGILPLYIVCNGVDIYVSDGVSKSVISDTPGEYTYRWYFENMLVGTTTLPYFNPTTNGTGVYTVEIFDNNNCTYYTATFEYDIVNEYCCSCGE